MNNAGKPDKRTKVALVGLGGYGETYMGLLQRPEVRRACSLCGVVDPFAGRSAWHGHCREKGIPVYPSLDAFFRRDFAPLVILSTPVFCHRDQVLTCFRHGAHALCEKPLCATAEDAEALAEAADRAGLKLGVGFQWSFSDPIQALKRDILAGRFGRPLRFKACVSWPRPTSYYKNSPWKGRIRTAAGDLVNDSIVTNAAAHYLHNLFFLNGGFAERFEALTARAHAIETFDTCLIAGRMDNGCEFFFGATHCGETTANPAFELTFEEGRAAYDADRGDALTAERGREKLRYGALQGPGVTAQKITRMLEAVMQNGPVLCSARDTLPHLQVCSALFSRLDVARFPADACSTVGDSVAVSGLWSRIRAAYETGRLPARLV